MDKNKRLLFVCCLLFFSLFIINIQVLHSAGPDATAEVLKFDSLIQPEPRIQFSKGVEESVAPTSGSLSVTVPIFSLPGRGGMDLNLKHCYNSSSVPTFSDQDAYGGAWAHICFMYNIDLLDSRIGGLMHNKYGVTSLFGYVSEGAIMECIGFVLSKFPPVGSIINEVLKRINIEAIDNTVIHSYIPQMQLCVGEVRGIVGGLQQALSSINIDAVTEGGLDIFAQHPLDNPSVLLADGSTIGFDWDKGSSVSGKRVYMIKQPGQQGQYNLIYDYGKEKYIFQMKDGIRYHIKPGVEPVLYLGMGNLSLDNLLDIFSGLFGSVDDLGAGKVSGAVDSKSGDSGTLGTIKNFLGTLSTAGSIVQVQMMPYGVTEKIEDMKKNSISIFYRDGLFGPKEISKVTDSLGREIKLKYKHDNWFKKLLVKWPFFDLEEIEVPGGKKIKYSYIGDTGRDQPHKMIIEDFIGRKTKITYKEVPEKDSAFVENISDDYYYIKRIDYPIGGYVEYITEPIDNNKKNKYYYKDRDLTAEVVKRRIEHTSKIASKDIVNTTAYNYNFNVENDVIVSGGISFNILGLLDAPSYLAQGDVIGAVMSVFQGGIYFKFVKEVKGGQVNISYINGKRETYVLDKSTEDNYNHYLLKLELSGSAGGIKLFSLAEGEYGYRPSTMLLRTITEAGQDVETVVTGNTYNNKWFLTGKDIIRGIFSQSYTYSYDNYGNIVRETGPLGQETRYSYMGWPYIDKLNYRFMPSLLREQRTININKQGSAWQIANYYYDTQNYPPGFEYETQYVGNVNKIIRGLGLVSSNAYNKYGDIVFQKDEEGNKTKIGYDYGGGGSVNITATNYVTNYNEAGNPIGEEEAVTEKIFEFNTYYLTNETDAKGNEIHYVNDQLGRVREVRFPDSTKLVYNYNDVSDDLHVIVKDERQRNISGSHLKYEYDGLGRLKALEQHIAASEFEDNQARIYKSENFYNQDGTLEKVRDSQNRETHLTYDPYSRLTKIEYPDNTELETIYDYSIHPSEYIQKVVDARNNTNIYVFDKVGRLKMVIESPGTYGYETTYEYDTLGNLLSFKDNRTNKTKYQYDILNRLTNEIYPDGSKYIYAYDKLGNIINKQDAKLQNVGYRYDGLNRLIKINYPDGKEVRYGYDLNNNRAFVADDVQIKRYTYNNRNWLTREEHDWNGKIYQTGYAYNEVGDLTNQIYPIGGSVNYNVNTLHRTKKIKYNGNEIAKYYYNPMGTISSITLENGVKQTFNYDVRDRVLETEAKNGTNILHKQILEYDEVGNRLSDEDENGFKTGYDYDKLYRLRRVIYPGTIPNREGDTYFYYDSVGNRTTMVGRYMDHSYSYKPHLNQLTNLRINKTGGIYCEYDLNGNLIKEDHYKGKINNKEISKTVNLSWDAENRLTSIKYPHIDQGNTKGEDKIIGSGLEFTYDADGNRIYKVSYSSNINNRKNKQETYYLRDSSGSVIEEYEIKRISPLLPETKITNIYIAGILRIQKKHKGVIKDAVQQVISTTNVEYTTKDVLGSAAVLTDPQGKVVQRYKYSPFGNIDYSKGSSDNANQFTGKEIDPESGLTYFGARYYNPVIGRWISKDSIPGRAIDPQTLNRYLYCVNNPFKYIESDGRFFHRTLNPFKKDSHRLKEGELRALDYMDRVITGAGYVAIGGVYISWTIGPAIAVKATGAYTSLSGLYWTANAKIATMITKSAWVLTSARLFARQSTKKHVTWNAFQKSVKGLGYTKNKISELYKQYKNVDPGKLYEWTIKFIRDLLPEKPPVTKSGKAAALIKEAVTEIKSITEESDEENEEESE